MLHSSKESITILTTCILCIQPNFFFVFWGFLNLSRHSWWNTMHTYAFPTQIIQTSPNSFYGIKLGIIQLLQYNICISYVYEHVMHLSTAPSPPARTRNQVASQNLLLCCMVQKYILHRYISIYHLQHIVAAMLHNKSVILSRLLILFLYVLKCPCYCYIEMVSLN